MSEHNKTVRSHEPRSPLPGWPASHVNVEMTGAETTECIDVTIHGSVHSLHATTARMLHEQLAAYNRQVSSINSLHGTEIPLV